MVALPGHHRTHAGQVSDRACLLRCRSYENRVENIASRSQHIDAQRFDRCPDGILAAHNGATHQAEARRRPRPQPARAFGLQFPQPLANRWRFQNDREFGRQVRRRRQLGRHRRRPSHRCQRHESNQRQAESCWTTESSRADLKAGSNRTTVGHGLSNGPRGPNSPAPWVSRLCDAIPSPRHRRGRPAP